MVSHEFIQVDGARSRGYGLTDRGTWGCGTAKQVDGIRRSLGQPPEDDVALEGCRQVGRSQTNRCPIRPGHMCAPALSAVDQSSALQQLVGRRDSGSGHAELRGENPLRGEFRPWEEIVPLDSGGKRRSEPSLQRPLTPPPSFERAAQFQGQPHANT